MKGMKHNLRDLSHAAWSDRLAHGFLYVETFVIFLRLFVTKTTPFIPVMKITLGQLCVNVGKKPLDMIFTTCISFPLGESHKYGGLMITLHHVVDYLLPKLMIDLQLAHFEIC